MLNSLRPAYPLPGATPLASRGHARSVKRIYLQSYALGAVVASVSLALLLNSWNSVGEPIPPSLNEMRFSVAVLAGPKQAAQTAPENVDKVVESTVVTPEPVSAPVVVAERKTSLPEAVAAAQTTAPAKVEVTKEAEVIPPAKVSMPGGKLMAEDAPIGDGAEDPFSIKPRQVYIRLLVDETGQVIRAGVVRSGGDNFRDSIILKAMKSRKYNTSSIKLKVQENGQQMWQLEMVIDYGTNDFLP